MTDLPNVPDDIGGLAKLDQTTQVWLAQLDTANLAKLTAMNSRDASAEASVTSINTNITTAVNRQNTQQTAVNTITSRNDSITTRINNRFGVLASDQSTINGFPGQISSLTTTKGRGFIGRVGLDTFTNVPHNGGQTPFGHFTFNDPAPNANRIYRAFASATLSIPNGSGTSYSYIGLTASNGTTFPGYMNTSVVQSYDGGSNHFMTVFIEYVFSNMNSSQWTLWISLIPNSGFDFTAGAAIGDFMTLEDIGLQL